MNISIIGNGAIGSLLAHKLVNIGNFPHLWDKTNNPIIQSHLINLNGKKTTHTFKANNSTLLIKSDTIFICLKAHAILKSMHVLQKYISYKTNLIFVHNGIISREKLNKLYPYNSKFIMVTSLAAQKLNLNTVRHTGDNFSWIGAINKSYNSQKVISRLINLNFIKLNSAPQIYNIQLKKLCINMIINYITTVNDCKNGALAQKKYNQLILDLSTECRNILEKEQFNIELEEILAITYEVIKKTKNNTSSMLQDKINNRKTEADYISGYFIELAHKHNLEIPLIISYHNKIKQLQERIGHDRT